MSTNYVGIYQSPQATEYPIPIIYEDNHLLFAIKPAGLLSQEDHSGSPDIHTILKEYLVVNNQKPGDAWLGLLHRLDQTVSGVMVFAKTSKAASRMSELFRLNEIDKRYYAVVHGCLEQSNGCWEDKISSEKLRGRYFLDSRHGKKCSLEYVVKAESKSVELTLLEIKLITGRAHQIRVQTSSRKHPIVGDRRYGLIEHQMDRKTSDIALFASGLEFIHPVRKTPIKIEVPCPNHSVWAMFAH